ncbi:MAG: phosphoglycerate dehydrogenase [Ignavibacteriales bacterium]|nr:phosphoglycerate dehydrogenase [Ignavibacteriales bacterium]MBK7981542.1 phosphoglycerate dehydrogenase [Ignavibacteriota bacterium]
MKVLIADSLPDFYIERLRKNNIEVIYSPKLGENDLPEAAKDVDIIVVRSTKVNEKTILESKCLNLIVRAGAGYNNINVAAANKRGVYVANCPGKNAHAVAELAIGLMISLDRQIPSNVSDFKNGVWNKAKYSKSKGLFGKTLAIVGMGNIGREVATIANAMGMNVYGKDISRIEGVEYKDFSEFDQVLPLADVISLHLPVTTQTKGMFDDKMFGYIKPGAILINTSRAEVINEDSLIKAVKEKNIKVALDVFAGEPEGKDGAVSSKLQDLENVYVTHHIGASTEQAQNAVAEEAVNIILKYIESGTIAHWVNKAKSLNSYYQLAVKHFDKPGVLASIMDVLRQGNINIEEVENIIFDGGLVALCTMKLVDPATNNMLEAIRKNPNIINVSHTVIG